MSHHTNTVISDNSRRPVAFTASRRLAVMGIVLSTMAIANPALAGKPTGGTGGEDPTLTALAAIQADLDAQKPKVVFITQGAWTGDLVTEANLQLEGNFLDGVSAANALCQNEADDDFAIVPPGTYKALISDFEKPASAQVSYPTAPIVRPDGAVVVGRFSDALVGWYEWMNKAPNPLIVAINIDAQGIPTYGETWTGSNTYGTGPFVFDDHNQTCGNWTHGDSSRQGYVGNANVDSFQVSGWLRNGYGSCDQPRRLYCVQQ